MADSDTALDVAKRIVALGPPPGFDHVNLSGLDPHTGFERMQAFLVANGIAPFSGSMLAGRQSGAHHAVENLPSSSRPRALRSAWRRRARLNDERYCSFGGVRGACPGSPANPGLCNWPFCAWPALSGAQSGQLAQTRGRLQWWWPRKRVTQPRSSAF